jgi:surface polysaccharide O-acyltransferase-like enzyme
MSEGIVEGSVDRADAAKPVKLPVDLIRFVAIVLVIVLHASVESFSSMHLSFAQEVMYWWTSTIYNSVAMPCVPLFIMLSGAFLLQPSKVNEPIRVFLRKRFTRLGFAFAFWSVVYFAWSYFINGLPLSLSSVVQGLLGGPYYHMWFIYLIVGLYLITPMLRVIVARGERKIVRYLIVLWFLGVVIVPFMQLITPYEFNNGIFVVGGWIGYYLLGYYLLKTKARLLGLYGLLVVGFVSTMIGAWFLSFPFNSVGRYYFFFDSLTINVVLASVALFLILNRYPVDWPGPKHPYVRRIIGAISANTLTIYLFHIIILESLQKGFFGFRISLTIINPIVEVPIAAAFTLFISLGLVLIMKKVPILKNLIG